MYSWWSVLVCFITHRYICIYTHVYIFTYIYIYAVTSVFIYIYIYLYNYIYIYHWLSIGSFRCFFNHLRGGLVLAAARAGHEGCSTGCYSPPQPHRTAQLLAPWLPDERIHSFCVKWWLIQHDRHTYIIYVCI